jgi:hypothetical protein
VATDAVSLCSVSAISAAISLVGSGAMSSRVTLRCWRTSRIAAISGWPSETSLSRNALMSSSDSVFSEHATSLSRWMLSGSAHSMSSRNSTSGCDRRVNTWRNVTSVWLNRLWLPAASSGTTGGCGPMIRSSAGIASTTTRPLGAIACRIRSRHPASSSSLSVSRWWVRSLNAVTSAV